MKISPSHLVLAASLAFSPMLPALPVNDSSTNLPPATEYQVVQQGDNHNVWQSETFEKAPDGKVMPRVHQYTELATGLNYRDASGNWRAAREEITIMPDGTAEAVQGQHKAYFPVDIYNGVIKMVTPDGLVLQSQPSALSYSDGNNTALIGVLTNSTGYLAASNQVIYPNAFSGIKADLRYTYTRAGFEQDVILHEQPPLPASLGLNPEKTKLEVLTEFLSVPAPKLTRQIFSSQRQSAVDDEDLAFGDMTMVPGKAFALGNESKRAQVTKNWVNLEGRQFLLEEVATATIEEELEALPAPATQSRLSHLLPALAKERILPPQHLVKAQPRNKSIQLAKMDELKSGYVLDYVTLNTGQANYVFQGDMTYYINGQFNLSGTTVFEGGAVLKYPQANPAGTTPRLSCGTILWQGSAYHPTLFTAVDDNSVGETISGSTGVPGNGVNYANGTDPTNYYGWPAVEYYNNTNAFTASNFRMTYIGLGLQVDNGRLNVTNAQFFDCRRASIWYLHGGPPISYLRNVLCVNLYSAFDAYNSSSSPGPYQPITYDVQNSTFVNMLYPVGSENTFTGSTNGIWYLTNCIFAKCSTLQHDPSLGWQVHADHNGFYSNTIANFPDVGSNPIDSTNYPFQSVGGGNYYLTNNSVFRNVGTTNIDPALLANVATKTTYPPVAYTNVTFTNAQIFSPQAQRDNDGYPDLGYHYDSLDYSFGGCTVNSNVIFTAGTAAGWFRTSAGWYHAGHGIHVADQQTVAFNGTVGSPTYWVRLNAVQEDDLTAGNGPGGMTGWAATNTLSPQIRANFLKGSTLAGDGNLFRDDNGYLMVNARNSEFLSGGMAGCAISLFMTNCLYDRSFIGQNSGNADNAVFIRDCTFHGGDIYLTTTATLPVDIQNCALDGTAVTATGYATNATYATYDYNATNSATTAFPIGGSHNVLVTGGYNWQKSSFGNYYLPPSSPLIDMGSTTADQVGLYQFTTQTSQVKEGNSQVDIGYHYVATDIHGNPIDTDGDGVSDDGEDANGNGIFDSGDSSDWQDYFNGALPNLTITAGNNQVGKTNTILALPLTIKVADTNGLPLANAPLNFSVTEGSAQIAIATNGTFVSSISLRTGTDGQASVWLLLPSGMATNIVTVDAESGTNLIQTNFTESPIIPFKTAPMLAVGGESLMELTADGGVVSWGGNQFGELGDYTYLDSTNPVHAVGLSNIVKIASSTTYSLAIDATGQLWSWGQLDQAYATNLPVPVCGMTNTIAIAAHADQYVGGSSILRLDPDHAYALSDPAVAVKADGTVWMWGTSFCDDYGPVPAQIIGISNVISVAAGNCQTFALTTNGCVWEWGNGNTTPVQVAGLSNIVAICTGDFHTLALTADGQVWAWGQNFAGQLGDNEAEYESDTPVLVAGLTNVTAIAAGSSHSLALDATGVLWAWGNNYQGEFGNYDTYNAYVPQQIFEVSNIVAIAAGSDASVVMTADGSVWPFGSSDYDGTSWVWGDVSGNPQLSPVYADFYQGMLPGLTITNGNNQAVHGNSEFPDPLMFQVLDAGGLALSNAPVSIEVIYGDMELRTNSGGANFKGLRLTSDAHGYVSVIGFADENPINASCLIRVLAASGARVVEADFNETVLLQPTISITAPTDGGVYLVGTNQPLIISVDAEAALGTTIQEVDYSVGTDGYADTSLGVSSTSPYTFLWTNADWQTGAFVGQYTLSAIAVDNTGGQSDPAPGITFTVALDADGNGLPDYWEVNYFGTNGLDPNSSMSGNGKSLLYEYQNGFDPTDYYNGTLPHLEIVGGNDQDGHLNAFLPVPVIVRARVASNQAFAPFLTNAPIQFVVTGGTALLAASTNDVPTNSIVLRTGPDGNAYVWVYFPAGGSGSADSTIVATAFSGGSSVSTTINEFIPMAHWTFNDTNSWVGDGGQMPLLVTNVSGVASWSSNAVGIDVGSSASLAYNVVETNGATNLTCATGSLRFWFKPDWTSTNNGGNGPGSWGRLIEVGSYSPSFTNGWWSLYVNPAGTQIFFGTSTNGAGTTNLIGNISWYSNEWYQIALTYSPAGSAVYVDGQLLANGAGITYVPNNDELTNGFQIGSDQNGNNQAQGAFDELETFAYPLDADNTYTHQTDIPDWWEVKYFNETGLPPESDPAGNGLNLLTYYSYGTDPNQITFSLSGANAFINTNVVSVQINDLVGLPAGMAVIIAYSNTPVAISNMYGTTLDFSTATWVPFDTNIIATLTSGDGPYDVWVGLRGREPEAVTNWEQLHVTLDTVPPVITITNPVVNVVSQPIIQLQGFANKTLSSLTYDISNATGILTNQTGYLTGQYYDTNVVGFTTNYFQCYDIATTTNGANSITLHATDLAGNTSTTNFTFTVDYSGKTNPPALLISWPTNGAVLAGTSFSIKGLVDDPTAIVTATVSDTDGNTNSVPVLVGRNGGFLGNNLPLSVGTNLIVITATDVVGNTSTNNFIIVGNDVGLVVNPLGSNQLNQASINITGSIGDPSYQVTVNGIPATVDPDGRWESDLVPISDTGTATIDTEVTDGSGNPLGSQKSFQQQPATIDLMSFSKHTISHFVSPVSPNDEFSPGFTYWPLFNNEEETINWNYQSGGHDVGYSLSAQIVGFVFSYVYGYPETNYYQYDNFSPGRSDVTNGDAFVDSVPWQNAPDTSTHVMAVPSDQAAIGSKSTYLISARAWDAHGQQLPSSSFKIQGVNLTPATNADGSVFGNALVNVPGGINFDATPINSDTKYKYTFDCQVNPVGLVSVESSDRLVHGIIEGAPGEVVSVGLTNATTGQSFGVYNDLFSTDPSAIHSYQTYLSEDDVLSSDEIDQLDGGTYAYGDQPVVFVRDPSDPNRMHFYMLSDGYGNLKINVSINRPGETPVSFEGSQPLSKTDLGDTITYLDNRIDSPGTDTVSLPATPAPLKQRSLLTKILIGFFKTHINTPFALTRGTVEGFWGGMSSDYDGLAGLSSLAGRFTASAAERAAVIRELRSITWNGIYTQMANGLASFMSQAERNSVLVNFGQADPSLDDFTAQVYVDGYAMGFSTEQIISFTVGAAVASKIGVASKAALLAVKGGQYVVDGVSGMSKFKVRAITWLVEAAKNNVVTETIAKSGGTMVKNVANLPTLINGKTVGQIIGEQVNGVGAIYDELVKLGKPLDDFGVKVHEKLAQLIEVDIGSALTDSEIRGFVRVYSRLEYGTGDYYDKLTTVFRTESTTGKQRLGTALAAYADPTSVPDKDLLTIAYVASKDVAATEHPQLLLFQQRVEALKTSSNGQQARYYEGFAGARYERDHPGITLTQSTDAAWDFNTSGGLKLEMKGPITIASGTGSFLSDDIVQENISSLAESIADELPTTPANFVVVDTFGLSDSQQTQLLDYLTGLGVTDLSRVIFQ